jgi:hypothetical protein
MDDNYLERSGAYRIIQAMVQQLRETRPTDPAEFMVQFLQDNYTTKRKRESKRRSLDCTEDDLYDEGELDEELERPSAYLLVQDSPKRKRRGISPSPIYSPHFHTPHTHTPQSSQHNHNIT